MYMKAQPGPTRCLFFSNFSFQIKAVRCDLTVQTMIAYRISSQSQLCVAADMPSELAGCRNHVSSDLAQYDITFPLQHEAQSLISIHHTRRSHLFVARRSTRF